MCYARGVERQLHAAKRGDGVKTEQRQHNYEVPRALGESLNAPKNSNKYSRIIPCESGQLIMDVCRKNSNYERKSYIKSHEHTTKNLICATKCFLREASCL